MILYTFCISIVIRSISSSQMIVMCYTICMSIRLYPCKHEVSKEEAIRCMTAERRCPRDRELIERVSSVAIDPISHLALTFSAVTLSPCRHRINQSSLVRCIAHGHCCPLDNQPIDEIYPIYETAIWRDIQDLPERRGDAEQSYQEALARESLRFGECRDSWRLTLGKKNWEEMLGNVGDVPPIPAFIENLMQTMPCPFSPHKNIGDTHFLVYIPERVNDKPLTLRYLRELVMNPLDPYFKRKVSV